jgi:hypothetical protein
VRQQSRRRVLDSLLPGAGPRRVSLKLGGVYRPTMSTGEGEDVFINEHLVARKDPDREAWEITDAEGAYRGRVVEAAGGFQALKPFGKEFYSVGTFESLETAARAVVGTSGPGRR